MSVVKIGKKELFSFAERYSNCPVREYATLADGHILCTLFSRIFPTLAISPASDQTYSVTQRRQRNWEALFQAFSKLHIPIQFLDPTALAANDADQGFATLVLFYFLFHLTKRTDFTAEFKCDVPAPLLAFLQSLDSLTSLLLGEAIDWSSIPDSLGEEIRSSPSFHVRPTEEEKQARRAVRWYRTHHLGRPDTSSRKASQSPAVLSAAASISAAASSPRTKPASTDCTTGSSWVAATPRRVSGRHNFYDDDEDSDAAEEVKLGNRRSDWSPSSSSPADLAHQHETWEHEPSSLGTSAPQVGGLSGSIHLSSASTSSNRTRAFDDAERSLMSDAHEHPSHECESCVPETTMGFTACGLEDAMRYKREAKAYVEEMEARQAELQKVAAEEVAYYREQYERECVRVEQLTFELSGLREQYDAALEQLHEQRESPPLPNSSQLHARARLETIAQGSLAALESQVDALLEEVTDPQTGEVVDVHQRSNLLHCWLLEHLISNPEARCQAQQWLWSILAAYHVVETRLVTAVDVIDMVMPSALRAEVLSEKLHDAEDAAKVAHDLHTRELFSCHEVEHELRQRERTLRAQLVDLQRKTADREQQWRSLCAMLHEAEQTALSLVDCPSEVERRYISDHHAEIHAAMEDLTEALLVPVTLDESAADATEAHSACVAVTAALRSLAEEKHALEVKLAGLHHNGRVSEQSMPIEEASQRLNQQRRYEAEEVQAVNREAMEATSPDQHKASPLSSGPTPPTTAKCVHSLSPMGTSYDIGKGGERGLTRADDVLQGTPSRALFPSEVKEAEGDRQVQRGLGSATLVA